MVREIAGKRDREEAWRDVEKRRHDYENTTENIQSTDTVSVSPLSLSLDRFLMYECTRSHIYIYIYTSMLSYIYLYYVYVSIHFLMVTAKFKCEEAGRSVYRDPVTDECFLPSAA